MPGTHAKLVFEETPFGYRTFADHYRYALDAESDDGPRPLILYIGGSIAQHKYEQRFFTRPDEIEQILDESRKHWELRPLDALIVSCPYGESEDLPKRLQFFREHLLTQLVPAIGNRLPSRIGLVGYSLGAFFATSLAFSLPDVTAMATLGGSGMLQALVASGAEQIHGPSMRCFANDLDDLQEESITFAEALRKHEIYVDLVKLSGSHPFLGYAENGSVDEAFRFVLSSLFR